MPLAPGESMSAIDLFKLAMSKLHDQGATMSMNLLEDLEMQLISVLAFIRTRKNSRCLINCLPAEVLGMIFEDFVFMGQKRDGRGFRASFKGSLFLTQICRHWSTVARGTPVLWSTFPDVDYGWPRVFLERSGAVPLRVSLLKDPSNFMANLLRSDGRRIQSLRWNGFTRKNGRYLKYLGAGLNDLTVVGSDRIKTTDTNPFLGWKDRTPHLRLLYLSDFPSWVPEGCFPYLTLLSLRKCHGKLSSFITLLRQCPSLEHLVVTGPMEVDTIDEEHVPSLPRLRSVALQHNACALLSHITVGQETSVQLCGPIVEDNGLSTALANVPSITRMTRLSIEKTWLERTIIAMGPSTGIYVNKIRQPAFLWLPKFLPKVLCSIRELWISSSGFSAEWEDYPGTSPLTLPALETLYVDFRDPQCVRGVLDALAVPNTTIYRPMCPQLSKIHITIHHPDGVDEVLTSLVRVQPQLGFEQVVIRHPKLKVMEEQQMLSKWDAHFPFIRFEPFDKELVLEFPPSHTGSPRGTWWLPMRPGYT